MAAQAQWEKEVKEVKEAKAARADGAPVACVAPTVAVAAAAVKDVAKVVVTTTAHTLKHHVVMNRQKSLPRLRGWQRSRFKPCPYQHLNP